MDDSVTGVESGTPCIVMVGGVAAGIWLEDIPGKVRALSRTCLGAAMRTSSISRCQHPSWRPLHEEIHAFVLNRSKAQSFVEPQGRVEFLHVDAHGLVG